MRWTVKAGAAVWNPTPNTRAEAYKLRKNLKALGYLKPTVIDNQKSVV